MINACPEILRAGFLLTAWAGFLVFNTLDVTVDGPIGQLWLNRPDRLNALSLEVLNELTQAAGWFNQHADVRVVIIGGKGRAFSAGADLDGFPSMGDVGLRDAADAGRIMADAVEQMQAVTIARLQGWCVGGGLVLAAACDLRVATPSARFSIPEVDLGIPLAWGGIPRLVREIGPAMTKELVMTCREFDSVEARTVGLLNRIVDDPDLDREVGLLAQQIVDKPKMPVNATKSQVNAVTAQMVDLGRSVSDADSLISGLLDSECIAAREAYVKARRKSPST